MLNLASPIAKNVQISITIPKGLQFTKAYGVNTIDIIGNKFTAMLPDLYQDMELPVLIHFLLINNKADQPLLVSINYLNQITGKSETVTEHIQLSDQNNGSSNNPISMNAELKKMYVVAFVNDQLL